MLLTTGLEFNYSGEKHWSFPDLNCEKGSKWLILGPSGCGKTTWLHLIGGLLMPQKGVVQIDGVALSRLSGTDLDRFRGQNIGIVFQQSHFVQSLTVLENVLLAQHLAGVTIDKKRIVAHLEALNMGHKLYAKPAQLSVGEAQRVAIVRALANRPKLILADEPTAALDDHHAQEVRLLLEQQAAEVGATLVIVTHDGRLKSHFPHQILL